MALAAFAGPAMALPLGLPTPGAPTLPSLPGTGPVTGRLGDTFDDTLGTVRRDIVGRPQVPANTFDRDENGARVVRREVLAIAPGEQALAAARAQGFEIVRTDTLGPLGLSVTVLRPPSGMRTGDALKALRAADPSGTYEYDHVYDPAGEVAHAVPGTAQGTSFRGTIGIVDGGIDLGHSAFEGASIVVFNAASKRSVPTAHGTAIASLLVGSHGNWHGAAPGARLYAADVFGGGATGGSAEAIARGLAWLAENRVPVINISLSGPPNALVGAAVHALVARGFVIVAAVGNDGPAVPVSYPAAYDGVVAVTSVDASRKAQLDANRGPAVMFASLGVDVRAAKAGGGYSDFTGTSFASPVVAANFAALVTAPDVAAVRNARAKLENLASDLGMPGRDPVYGFGFLPSPVAPLESAAR